VPQERIPETTEDEQRALFGPLDRNLRAVRERYGVKVVARRGGLIVEGEDARAVHDVGRRVRLVLERLRGGVALSEEEVESILLNGGPVGEGRTPPGRSERAGPAVSGPRRKAAGFPQTPRRLPPPTEPAAPGEPRPLTDNQQQYVRAIRTRDVVFATGPAGTGKTFLAVAEAVAALRSGSARRIVLTRPAVEAGEKLGFLPGDFQAKINPYLRPLYDALAELLPYGEVRRYLDNDIIEIVPLAYMRGRTLKNAFIILDEGQNTTPAQMKMFLTRMGAGSKVVVNGDITQVDLPGGAPSGLVESVGILERVKGIAVVRFGARDILRHPLVQRIVDAYDRAEGRVPLDELDDGDGDDGGGDGGGSGGGGGDV
jgi:phosphate starvation-inducible PhoH-like protein